jgi:hypothetical protein
MEDEAARPPAEAGTSEAEGPGPGPVSPKPGPVVAAPAAGIIGEHSQEPPVAPALAAESAAPTGADLAGQVAAEISVEAQRFAAVELIKVYQALPELAAVKHLFKGETAAAVHAAVEDARKVYTTVRNTILAEVSAALPQAHGGAGAAPVPETAFEMIRDGVSRPGSK